MVTLAANLHLLRSCLLTQPLLELELRKHPHEKSVDRLDRNFITVRGDAKVFLLKSFLNEKLKSAEYEITATLDDDSVVLDDDMALIHARETLCQDNQVMVLKYKVAKVGNPVSQTEVDAFHARGATSEVSTPN